MGSRWVSSKQQTCILSEAKELTACMYPSKLSAKLVCHIQESTKWCSLTWSQFLIKSIYIHHTILSIWCRPVLRAQKCPHDARHMQTSWEVGIAVYVQDIEMAKYSPSRT